MTPDLLNMLSDFFFSDYTKIFLLIWLIIVWLFIFRTRRRNKHHYNRKKSKLILEKIRSFSFDGQRISYLRKINPFVFEELLLDAFEAKGFKVVRNKRYTGDQGIDGVVYKEGKKYLIQAKRYKGHVNLQHIRDFNTLVESQDCCGYFCHTGKTGKGSKETAKCSRNIKVISGDALITLIVDQVKNNDK